MTIRDRLNQLQSKANWTMEQWQDVAMAALKLLADIEDGVGVKMIIDENAREKALALLRGGTGEVPLTLVLDPSYSYYPQEQCTFLGGAYNTRTFRLTVAQRCRRSITLQGGQTYVWTGHRFEFDGIHTESALA